MIRSISDRRTFERFRSAPVVRRGPVRVRFLAPDEDGTHDRGIAAPADLRGTQDVCLAFAIGKRVGNAVVRNRIRRRLRGAATVLSSSRGLPSGSYLVTADVRAASDPFGELTARLGSAMAEAARLPAPAPTP